jgi:hypothetical protein
MYSVSMTVAGYRSQEKSYAHLDDAFRFAHALWRERGKMLTTFGLPLHADRQISFEIVADDGSEWQHDEILNEIQARPELREPQKIY